MVDRNNRKRKPVEVRLNTAGADASPEQIAGLKSAPQFAASQADIAFALENKKGIGSTNKSDLGLPNPSQVKEQERIAPVIEAAGKIGEPPIETPVSEVKRGIAGVTDEERAANANLTFAEGIKKDFGSEAIKESVASIPALASRGAAFLPAIAPEAAIGGVLAAQQIAPAVNGAKVAQSTAGSKLLGVGILGAIINPKKFIARKQAVTEAVNLFNNSKANVNSILKDLNSGLYAGNEIQAIQDIEKEILNIRRQEKALRLLSDGDLNNFLTGAGDNLDDVQDYLTPRNINSIRGYTQLALQKPNPNAQFDIGTQNNQGSERGLQNE